MAQIHVQGFGDAITGLDWVELPGMDTPAVEVRQLARSANAQWQFTWKKDGKATPFVSFVPHGTSKKAPYAAAMLVCSAIHDQNFMTLIEIEDLQYWVFAAVNGVPAKRMDFVGKAPAVLNSIRDFISTIDSSEDFPVYTNLPELLDTLPFSFDIRPFSLDILGHSIQKKDYSKAKFQRYSPISRQVLVTVGFLALGSIGYTLFENQIEQMQKLQAEEDRKIALEEKIKQLSSSIDAAINTAPPVSLLIPAYWQTLQELPLQINGWKLISFDCQQITCTLTYKSQAFATWHGYLIAKPKHWGDPVYTTDTTIVTQLIDLDVVETHKRITQQLQSRESLQYVMGNLSQLIAPLGMQLRFQSNWERVVGLGKEQKSSADGLEIPVRSDFNVTGPAILLNDFSQRLPLAAGFMSLQVKLDEKSSFELKGQIYARP